jgi:hypothetical protein
MTRLYRGVVTEDDLVFDKGVLTATDSGRIDKLVELLASNPS